MGGTVLAGSYRVREILAEGGMGVVYRGEHTRSAGAVAIKFLGSGGLSSREAYDRFLQEARLAASVDHAGIIKTFDLGITQGGTPYMVMEHLEGQDLGRVLAERRLGLSEAVDVAEQILEALRAVHSAGIVHRDLKPGNVFIARQSGGESIVKILDFGVSRLMTGGDAVDRLTEAGRLYGTPHYASPEAARGSLELDHRADLYAVGVLLYEMLCGRPPFDAPSAARLLVDIVTSTPPDPASIREEIPEALAGVIMHGLEKEPSRRFQSAGWMLRALRSARRSLPGRAVGRDAGTYSIVRPRGGRSPA
jgi:serine/threonine-protein kinase